jgi:hypothetical protein
MINGIQGAAVLALQSDNGGQSGFGAVFSPSFSVFPC